MTSKQAIQKIMSILNITEQKFYDGKTEQGITVKMEGDSLEVGKMLYVATEEGMIPAPAGSHKMEDGSEVEVDEDGKVSKIKMGGLEKTDDAKIEDKKSEEIIKSETMAESSEPMVEMEDGDIKLKDGMVIRIGGESPETGTLVKKVGYDGTLSALADGSYETSDGKVMSVVGGEIKGIQSKKASDARGEGYESVFTEAKTGDGVVLESPTFDVGESIEVMDGDKKLPAPDGEHQIMLKDSDGNEVKIRVIVKDGKIVERENVEEESEDDMSGFVEAFSQAMKRIETKIDQLNGKYESLETKFKKFSSEPAGSRVTKNQINKSEFSTQSNTKVEGFKRLREQLSHNN